ncbi:response regulator [Pseudolabrys taiwanensis]|uniref:Response regulator n=1 Tax=Pseudolabrys taiwanensis TaxID=331696 RepID=A0A345ZUZ8_9HYPH|nr:response regulator [Pseudolabrys taiwanensis]AXK80745.1 response regulator [Pseudolabrys taiwanensis]
MSKPPIISIIDDDESVRDAVGDLVSSLGFDARVFASAEDFLSSADYPLTVCVITDMQMPGMSGQDLQHKLVAEGQLIPMIFITAFPEARTRDSVMAKGALAFLEKPFDGRVLSQLIRHVTAAAGPAA